MVEQRGRRHSAQGQGGQQRHRPAPEHRRDGDNPLGYGNLVWDNGDAGATLVDEELLYIVGAAGAGNLEAGVQDDGGVFSDDTTDLNSIGAGDVAVYTDPATTEDAFYFGMDDEFNLLLTPSSSSAKGKVERKPCSCWKSAGLV